MEIFICWSGTRSKELAVIMKKYLPEIIHEIVPFVSTDITKGQDWHQEVNKRLQNASAGLICLTRENLRSPWIHFEAGSLAHAVSKKGNHKKFTGRIFTYLLGVAPTEVQGPLAAYQSTVANREDTHKLIRALVDTFEVQENWEDRFEIAWPKIEKKIMEIKGLLIKDVVDNFENTFRRKTFEEPLSNCTEQTWLRRLAGARETRLTLLEKRITVEASCRAYVVTLYNKLISELDGYEMDMSSLLLKEKKFKISENGNLAIKPKEIEDRCEMRRLQIKKLVSALVDLNRAPIMDQSATFAFLQTFQEKKDLIHNIQAQLESLAESISFTDAVISDWDLDRIAKYLIEEWLILNKKKIGSIADVVNSLRIELEKVRAKNQHSKSLIALHYSLDPIKAWLSWYLDNFEEISHLNPLSSKDLNDLNTLLEDIKPLLKPDPDGDVQLKRNLDDLHKLIARISTKQ